MIKSSDSLGKTISTGFKKDSIAALPDSLCRFSFIDHMNIGYFLSDRIHADE